MSRKPADFTIKMSDIIREAEARQERLIFFEEFLTPLYEIHPTMMGQWLDKDGILERRARNLNRGTPIFADL